MLYKFINRHKVVMTIPEFLEYQRGNLSLREISNQRKIEDKIDIIVNNKKYRKIAVFLLAGAFMIFNPTYAYGLDTTKIDTLGMTLLSIIQKVGYWYCMIMAGKEILQALTDNRAKDVPAILLKHVVAFAGFYALPWCFDLVKDLLK